MIDALVSGEGRKLSSRFTLLEKIGAGGQGEVWRAQDETRGIVVALKVLSPGLAHSEEAWAALEREYAISSRLDHPNILKVYPPYREGDFVALPMELASGGDLRRLRGASYLEIVPVLIEVAQALEHAHDRGIVHRDLKPGNVLFDARGRVRVADFGIAGSTDGATSPLRAGVSPFTASPEQLRGEPPSIADDVYGFGALAYELLSGYPPYYPRFDVRRALEEPVPELKAAQQIPPQLHALVMRMVSKRAIDRPRSMRDIIDELDVALNDTLTFEFDRLGTPATVQGIVPPAPAPTPRTDTIPVAPVSVHASVSAPAAPAREVPAAAAAPASDKTIPRVREPAAVRPAAQAASAAPVVEPTVRRTTNDDLTLQRPRWDDIKIVHRPNLMRLEPIRTRRWPWAALVVLAIAAFGVFYWLPRYAPPAITAGLPTLPLKPPTADADGPAASIPGVPDRSKPGADDSSDTAQSPEEELAQAREEFDKHLASLENRGAGVWGGKEFADAKLRAAEAVGASDAGNAALARERLTQAAELLKVVESKADQALAARISEGQRALNAGQGEVARQAFEIALRIDPDNRAATEGLKRVENLGGVLPLLADAENAEAAGDHSRAVQNYSKVLSLDPGNEKARAGLARANAALGEDSYARAVGAGYAALGAGRLDEARNAFEKAVDIRPNGNEARAGLARVNAALNARGLEGLRQRAAALEAEERWAEALKEYEAALKIDPSLVFAKQGRSRAAARAELGRRLQALIDEPNRLASPAVREEALSLIQQAKAQSPSGPVLRSQIARLEILLPEFDKPVRLALISDNVTNVAITRVGQFGTFSRREVELKPGKYTVVGTREGYRDVRREITVAPGGEIQTISVSCVEPI